MNASPRLLTGQLTLDGPKLELDGLIDQLLVMAQGVKQTQSRLRGLLKAIELVSGHLGLEALLQQVTESACVLVGAQYGALGVVAPDGTLEAFIHSGMSDALVAEIGHLPEGNGGLLSSDFNGADPLRLARISDDPRSTGFPAHHPPMESFLRVPIRVRGEIFGSLYLTESSAGVFSPEDEALAGALAVTVGTAISNARLYSESKLQQQWLAATAEVGAHLLADAGESLLHLVAQRVQTIASADLVVVTLLTPDERVAVEVAVGLGADALRGKSYSAAETLTRRAVDQRTAVVLDAIDAADDSHRRSALTESVIDAGPVIIVPLIGEQTTFGSLAIVRKVGRPSFTEADVEMATAFASQASVALELAAAKEDRQRIVLLEDRDRIARDLHDHVIQQLFAIGLNLQGVASKIVAQDDLAGQIVDRVDDIDETIRRIRNSIFDLRDPAAFELPTLHDRLLDLAVVDE